MNTKENVVLDKKENSKNNEDINNNSDEIVKNSKRMRIFGITIWRILAYFIIYSILGFFIETLYGTITKGLVESRQSFLYGPFCSIYGLGACTMIVCLQKVKKSHNYLFFGGFFLGAIIEYSVSFLGEMILHVKWWDYSNLPFNINGRICVGFSVFWGILAMYLLGSLNPKIDKLINYTKRKIKNEKILKNIVIITIILMMIDCIISGIAIKLFEIRKIEQYNLNVENRDIITKQYNDIYGNENLSKFIYKFWSDKKMIITFPNLKIKDKDGNMIYFDSLCPGEKTYYLKVYEKYNK
ncbi:MAG: putative ABC transporter permease [Clostridia bacterium]|nr:putative ABC transporter permease [Clostridia bacterium]